MDHTINSLIEETRKNLNRKRIVMVAIPTHNYHENILQLSHFVGEKYGKSIYVTVNKPYKIILDEFKERGIDPAKFYFIDCITYILSDQDRSDNCSYVKSPEDLPGLEVAIVNAIENEKPFVLLFDSVATLLAYNEPHEVIRLTHATISELNIKGVKGLFPYPKEQLDSELAKDLEMFADEIEEL